MTAPTDPTIFTQADVAKTLPPDVAGDFLPSPVDPAPRAEDAGRLELAAALAELDRAPAQLLEVEHRHGFTFGGPAETGPGRHAAAVACMTAGCDRQGRLVQVHDDTVLPVHCGGCGAVLHCDHAPEITRHREGTIGAPVEVTRTVCGRCSLELGRVERSLPPINLADLPLAILDQPLERS